MPEDTVAFVKSMVARFSALRSLFDEHVKDNDEVLPHVFFGDVTRFVKETVGDDQERTSAQFQEMKELLAFLENSYSNADVTNQHDGIANLIAVSFLEDFIFPEGVGQIEVRKLLGPALSRELKAMEAWQPTSR